MKKALVTGSSRGIGRAIAVRLAGDGYFVYVHAAGNLEKANETRDMILQNGGSAAVLTADLRNVKETQRLAESTRDADVLVLNASLQYRTPWRDITVEESYEQLNCDLLSSLLLIQSAVPYMQSRGWGRIVTVGSVQEAKPHPDMLIYSASKAAQTNMMRSLALQLAKDGITVNNVAPGVIYTDRNTAALADPDYAAKVRESIPVGFYGKPEDCAGIVSLLCSEEGRYITGQSIFVDGGKSAL